MNKFKCRICGKQEYSSLFQWNLALAADVRESAENRCKYPIEPVVCNACGHVQLKEALEINMYDNYLYTPSYSQEFCDYVASFAEGIDMMVDKQQKRVIEIGSSNGYLLKQMKDRDWTVLGFEPSASLAAAAEKKGIPTEQMYFGSDESKRCIEQWGKPDVIIMRHVMEHLDDLNGIVECIGNVLDDGLFIIEVPWLLKIIKEKQFYAFFHEHLSYFSVTAIQSLVQKYGFVITDVKENSLEGGSIAVYAYRGHKISCDETKISHYLELERKYCSVEQILEFSRETDFQISKIKNLVKSERKKGRRIAAWGAGQRGITLLNICGLNRTDIDYIVDVNENYWWKYVPGELAIQIVPPDWLEEHFVDSIIILATGYADEIISENDEYLRHGGTFIKILNGRPDE